MKRPNLFFSAVFFIQISQAFAQNSLIKVTANCQERECKLVFKVKEEIFRIAGISAPVYLAPIHVDISKPGSGIYLSHHVLHVILNNSAVSGYAEFIVQFLVAHELAHQIQFRNYAQNMSSISSCEVRRLYECQADILAGNMISELYRLDDSVALGSRFTPLMVHALEYVYKLGDDENSITSHPSSIQRRSAFRLGLAYSILKNKVYSDNKEIQESIDYRNNEDSLIWSLRLAKHIIHFPNAISKHIIYTSLPDKEFEQLAIWDTSSRNPVVKFKTGYFKNTDKKPVKLFLQVRLVGKEREFWNASKPFMQGRVLNFTVALQPGDSTYLSGELNWWGLSTSKRMPSLILPPHNEALYDVQFENGEQVSYDQGCPTSDFESMTDRESSESLALQIQSAERYATSNQFEDLKVGFGTSNSQNDDAISYSTAFGTRNGYESDIWNYSNDDPRLMMEIDKDSVEVERNFYLGVQALTYLAKFGIFKIKNDYRFYYDEGEDTSTNDSGKRENIYHIEHDTVLVIITKDRTSKTIEGFFLDSGTRVSVSELRWNFKGRIDYSTDIVIEPKEKSRRP